MLRKSPLTEHQHTSTTGRRPAGTGRSPLGAVKELALCIVVPLAAFLVWIACDDETRQGVLSGMEQESLVPANGIYSLIPLDEERILTVHSKGTIRIWDAPSKRVELELQSQLVELRCAAYSPVRNALVVATIDGSLEKWVLNRPSESQLLAPLPSLAVQTVAFSADGTLILTGDENGDVSLRDAETLALRGVLKGESGVAIRAIAIHSDGEHVLVGHQSGAVAVWNLPQQRLLRVDLPARTSTIPSGDGVDCLVEALFFLSDETSYIVVTRHQGLFWRRFDTGHVERQQEICGNCQSGALSADGQLLALGLDSGDIEIWNTATANRVHTSRQHQNYVHAVSFSDEGRTLASGDCRGVLRLNSYDDLGLQAALLTSPDRVGDRDE